MKDDGFDRDSLEVVSFPVKSQLPARHGPESPGSTRTFQAEATRESIELVACVAVKSDDADDVAVDLDLTLPLGAPWRWNCNQLEHRENCGTNRTKTPVPGRLASTGTIKRILKNG